MRIRHSSTVSSARAMFVEGCDRASAWHFAQEALSLSSSHRSSYVQERRNEHNPQPDDREFPSECRGEISDKDHCTLPSFCLTPGCLACASAVNFSTMARSRLPSSVCFRRK